MKKQTKIYFAGPLFSTAELDYNRRIARILKEAGYRVFLPQEDGFEGANEVEDNRTVSRKIFEKDTSEVRNADVVIMVLDGRVPDDGACVELGLAFGLGKRCYGIKTDTRALSEKFDLNPLIEGCFQRIFTDRKELVLRNGTSRLEIVASAEEELKKYIAGNEL